MLQPVKFLRVN